MFFKKLFTSTALAVAIAAPASAVPIALDFELQNASGTFYGLDNETSGPQSASSFDLIGLFGKTYTNVYSGSTAPNAFEFVDATLETSSFSIGGIFSDDSSIYLVSFFLGNLNGDAYMDLDEYFIAEDSSNDVRGTVQFTQRELSAVPLPAGGLLLLSGLAGFAAIRRRAKRIA